LPLNYGEQTYETVKIGCQTWIAKNLNYAARGSKCMELYENNRRLRLIDENTELCDEYGRLYSWNAVMDLPSACNKVRSTSSTDCAIKRPYHKGVCPPGWHIPRAIDWSQLLRYVDGVGGTSDIYESNTAGKYLKATSRWFDYYKYYERSGNGEDTYGFAAIPGGHFTDVGSGGFEGRSSWWSTYEGTLPGEVYSLQISNDTSAVKYWAFEEKSNFLHIRCVKD
jgi:uncharacterized protein (TIGR02145 family)